MGGILDALAQGTTAALLAASLLLPAPAAAAAAAAVKDPRLGTLINADKVALQAKRLSTRGRRLSSIEIPPEELRESLPLLKTVLALKLDDAGVDGTTISSFPGYMPEGVQTELVNSKQPLKIAFYNRLDSTRTQVQQDYIMDKLMPATGAVLARSMRVRTPSGPLLLAGIEDEVGETIPGPDSGIEADLLLKVASQPEASEECEGVVASAAPLIFEYITVRPLYGVVKLCRVNEDAFYYDITTLVHEILHALGFIGVLFPVYPGYGGVVSNIAEVGQDRTMVRSPNVVATVRDFFQCPQMAGAFFEDDGGQGTANAHWEERMFEGEMLDAGDSGSELHHNRHVLTDLSLSLMQDTNWYDVKYGSAGFNSYGYKAGCEFATGTFAEAYAAPAAKRYLCSGDTDYEQACLHDFSGDGLCLSLDNWDGFYRTYQLDEVNFDCQGDLRPGQRCLVRRASSTFSQGAIGCVGMECSASGKVVVDGSPCNSDKMDCPEDELMCGDPGLLTCAGGELNDCSGNGDCKLGRCFCHSGWGGDDCGTSVCISQCANGSPCPPSGFCGVPDCGEWSAGSESRGTPCNEAAGAAPTPDSSPPPPVSQGPGRTPSTPSNTTEGSTAVALPSTSAWVVAAAALVTAGWLW